MADLGLCKAIVSHTGSAALGFSFQSRRLSSVPGKYESSCQNLESSAGLSRIRLRMSPAVAKG